MNYVDEGSGPVVLMVHGNPTWSFYYRRLIMALRQTHRVIVPDHIGCGLSDKPQNYPYRLTNHIDNLGLLLRHLAVDEADMIVHDWGGAIGMGYAVRRELRVRRMVVLNTAAFLSPNIPLRIAVCKLPGFGQLAVRGFNAFAGMATVMAVETPMPADVKAGYLFPYRTYHDRIATLRFVQDIPMHRFHPTWGVIDAIDHQLGMFRDTPMQILWGGRDWCFDDSFLQGWMQRFPAASVTRFDQAGHYVLEDAGAEIEQRVVRFLTR
ncbi:MAG: alpha/beta fold hydrolase [Roseiflexaceae bacterium]|nr:alpha/beta fold hydrolase [Roseiflexaceae bacterium]